MAAKRKARAGRSARILAYLDPQLKNGSLLDLLVRLARRDGAEVLALSVLRDLPWYARMGADPSKKIRKILEDEARAALERDARTLVDAGLKVRTVVAWGRPFEVMIHEVLRQPTQLVLKTAQTPESGSSPRFGPTDMHLFRKCPVPVWVVKPRRTARIRRILAAVDPGRPTPGGSDVNAEILGWGSRLARQERAELHVCHAYSILGEHLLRTRTARNEYGAYLREAEIRVQEAMANLVSQVDLELGDRRVHLLKGDPGQLIPALAEKQKTDLLVMGTIARSGVPGLLIGNTAERILRAIGCSVLALKPRGFVSPVRPGLPNQGI